MKYEELKNEAARIFLNHIKYCSCTKAVVNWLNVLMARMWLTGYRLTSPALDHCNLQLVQR